MATSVQGIMGPVLFSLFIFNLASSLASDQSNLLSRLLSQVSNKDNPLIVVMEKCSDSSHSESGDHDHLHGLVHLYNEDSGKSKERWFKSISSSNRPKQNAYSNSNKYRNQYPDQHSDHHINDQKKPKNGLDTAKIKFKKNKYLQQIFANINKNDRKTKNRHDEDDLNRYQNKHDQVEKERNQYQNRLDQYKQNVDRKKIKEVEKESAKARLPVVKNILRSISCDARDNCENVCDSLSSMKIQIECKVTCVQKYECDTNGNNEDPCEQSDNSCGFEQKEISTKGVTLDDCEPGWSNNC